MTQLVCPECGEAQIESPSGTVCLNGHGGLDGVPLVCPPPPPAPRLTLIERIRDYVGEQFDKNGRYEALDADGRIEFIDDHINGLSTIYVLEIISQILENDNER